MTARTRNLTSRYVIPVLASLMFSSCSGCHRSGQNRDSGRERHRTEAAQEPSQENLANATVPASDNANRHKMDGTEIFERYNKAVFMVYTSDGVSGFQGSGFFINNEGLAVSNYHVFAGTGQGLEQIKLAGNDNAYKVAEVIHCDEENDFILFRVNVKSNKYIPIAQEKPKVGATVYAIGSPRGLENTLSDGKVSQWRDNARTMMQISVQIDHGSSGGALINEYGEVVGITSGTFADGSQANLNYAWSIDVVKPYLGQ